MVESMAFVEMDAGEKDRKEMGEMRRRVTDDSQIWELSRQRMELLLTAHT